MPSFTRSASGVADASGALTLTFDAPPYPYHARHSMAVTSRSPGATATVTVGGVLRGFIQSCDQGWARGIIAEQGDQVVLAFSGLIVADTVTVADTVDLLPLDEDFGDTTFEGSPPSSGAIDSTIQFASTVGTATIVTPGAGQFVRVLGAYGGLTANATTGGGASVTVRLITPLSTLARVYIGFAPAGVPAGAQGSTVSPWVPMGKGVDGEVDRALQLDVTPGLTGGLAFTVLEFQLIG